MISIETIYSNGCVDILITADGADEFYEGLNPRLSHQFICFCINESTRLGRFNLDSSTRNLFNRAIASMALIGLKISF